MTIFSPILKQRLWSFVLLIAVVLAGYYLRYYHGPLQNWVHRLSGSLLVVCFAPARIGPANSHENTGYVQAPAGYRGLKRSGP